MLQLLIAGSPARQTWVTRLAHQWARRGHLWLAEWALQQVVHYGDPTPALYYELGKLQGERDRLDEALHSLREGLRLKPNFYLCRRLLFDLVRKRYWTSPPGALPPPLSPSLRSAHLAMREALLPMLDQELYRLDDDNLDADVLSRLKARLNYGPLDRAQEALLRELSAHEPLLLQAIDKCDNAHIHTPWVVKQRATIHTREGAALKVCGLHDADDRIGYHLEVIIDDQLVFIPLSQVRSVEMGPRSDYINVEIQGLDEGSWSAVLPFTYFASHWSPSSEVREGEITVIQRLSGRFHVGQGRRSFISTDLITGERFATGAHEILSIHFEDPA